MEKPITVIKLAKYIRGIMRDVKDGHMIITLDFENGRLFLRGAEFHG